MEQMEKFLEDIYLWDADVCATRVGNEVCSTCRKPISGTAFYYRGRDLYFHISCLNAPTNEKALMIHFSSETGHSGLIFTEEMKNDGKENVVCIGCEKPVLGLGYKCSTSQCNILFHKSCFELPPQIQHPFHPNHTLLLVKPQKKHCNACGRNCNAYPFYSCSECNFNLDVACATRSRININADDCQHEFISLLKPTQFICEACGEDGMEFASQCSICQLLIHTKCARFPRIIWITRHDHSLALTYSLRQVKEHNNIFCKLCCEKVKIEYAAYYCQKCDYVAHLACAFQYEEIYLKWLPEEYVDLETNVMQVEGARQIQHFSHQHDLIFSNEELVDNKLCDGCMGLISTSFYSCKQCSFFLHSRCAQLPKIKRHPQGPPVSTHKMQTLVEREREIMGGDEEWRKNADTHKMSGEEVKGAGVEGSKRPPSQHPGGVLHQRRTFPYSYTTMAIGGLLITAAVGYFTLYVKKKPQATAGDVAKVAVGVAKPEDTHPRK